ncbi:MAG: hypothetical protein AAGH64_01930 [Planctomycetota bacterium]
MSEHESATRPMKDTPLDAELARTLGVIGARLHEQIAAIVACLPKEQRTAKGMTVRFKIEGVVARRLVRALAGEPGLLTLTRLPSPDHVRAFVNLVAFDKINIQACEAVRSSLDELDAATKGLGGGRARLTQRIRATRRTGDGA